MMNRLIPYLKNDLIVSTIYAIFLVTFHFIGQLTNTLVFGYSFSSIIGIGLAFIVLLIYRLKEIPKNNLLKALGICVKIAFLAMLIFFAAGFFLSFAINTTNTITLKGLLYEMPNLIVALITYGTSTLLFIIITMLIKLLMSESKKKKKTEDHLI